MFLYFPSKIGVRYSSSSSQALWLLSRPRAPVLSPARSVRPALAPQRGGALDRRGGAAPRLVPVPRGARGAAGRRAAALAPLCGGQRRGSAGAASRGGAAERAGGALRGHGSEAWSGRSWGVEKELGNAVSSGIKAVWE